MIKCRLKYAGRALVATAVVVCLSAAQTPAQKIFLARPDVLARVREEIRLGSSEYADALKKLLKEADAAVKQKPVSVMDKKQLPPSGDKHDYMSLAPYWWPDSTKVAGVPYIRRDGEVNPERHEVSDRDNIRLMTSSVYTLGLAWFFTGDKVYADHAAVMLRIWFLNPETRMNPNMNYGQAIKGRNDGRGAGLIETSGFRFVVDAIGLLESSTTWTPADQQGMKQWFDEYFTWLTTSMIGKHESNAKNNHGTWYDVQSVSIAFFLGKNDVAKSILTEAKTKRITAQIEPDGRMPLELGRTKALGYTTMNLNAFLSLVSLGQVVGIDLWSFTSDDGRCIRQAIDWALPYWTQERSWTYPQIIPFDYTECYPLIVQAWILSGNNKYIESARAIKEVKHTRDRARLLYGIIWSGEKKAD